MNPDHANPWIIWYYCHPVSSCKQPTIPPSPVSDLFSICRIYRRKGIPSEKSSSKLLCCWRSVRQDDPTETRKASRSEDKGSEENNSCPPKPTQKDSRPWIPPLKRQSASHFSLKACFFFFFLHFTYNFLNIEKNHPLSLLWKLTPSFKIVLATCHVFILVNS